MVRISDDLPRTRAEREAARPAGLAAFLGRVTGVSAIIAALHRRRDLRRYREFRGELAALADTQRTEADLLQRRHELQATEVARKISALDKIDAREMRALEQENARVPYGAARGGGSYAGPVI
ncbi:MAG TPA: hypothetical protein VGU72_04250 [Beijerinckiaceae bacterium]|nr:hypothetical protein [Beijerinckiaceae bacterium]